jgi:hypothetical protein
VHHLNGKAFKAFSLVRIQRCQQISDYNWAVHWVWFIAWQFRGYSSEKWLGNVSTIAGTLLQLQTWRQKGDLCSQTINALLGCGNSKMLTQVICIFSAQVADGSSEELTKHCSFCLCVVAAAAMVRRRQTAWQIQSLIIQQRAKLFYLRWTPLRLATVHRRRWHEGSSSRQRNRLPGTLSAGLLVSWRVHCP